MVTKTRRWIGKAAAVALASAIAVPFVAGMLPIRAGAAVEYSDNLVRYGTSEEYENDFLTLTESTRPTSPVKITATNYETRQWDVATLGTGGQGEYVLTEEGETYVRLYKSNATTDSANFFVWPVYLPAETYTVTANVKCIGLSTGDCFDMKYNGGTTYQKRVLNLTDYNNLDNSETVEGAKVMSYTAVVSETTQFPATQFWFYHKLRDGIEAYIYDITYTNSKGDVVYYNDFSQPFETQTEVDIPHYGFDAKDYGGIYNGTPATHNAGIGKIVRNRKVDGSVETYLRLFNDLSGKKDGTNPDTMDLYIQPVRDLPAGNYTYVIDFDLPIMNSAQHTEFQIWGGAAGNQTLPESKTYSGGADFAAIPRVDGRYHLELPFTSDVTASYLPLHIWFWHGNNAARQLNIYKVEFIDNSTEETLYSNDFSEAFTRDKVMSVGNRYDHNDGINSTVEKQDDGNVFIRMSGNYATLNTGLWYKEEGTQNMKPGLPVVADYTVEFDIGRSEDANGELEFFFASVDPTFNTASKILTVVADDDQFNALYDPSDEIEGWGHYKGTLKVNNLMLPNLLSMFCIYTGAGSVTIDNLSVRAKLGSVVIEETPSTEGLKFRDLVLGGDFDYLAEGTKFVGEPTNDTYFWGSTSSDTAGEIVDLDGNKVLKLQNDGDASKKWASAFVFLDPDELSEQNIYTLSYKFKYVEKEAFDPGIGLQVTFIGENGKEHYVQYLNWLDAISETSGENPSEWPFEVEYLDDDWISIEMTFCLNNTFMRDVNQSMSIRFLNFNDGSTEPTLYIDDVKFGVWEEPTAEVPGDDEPEGPQGGTTESGGKKKGCGSVIGIGAGEILTVSLAAAFVLGKRENNE